MEREQIIKALECCASEEYICTQCPIDEKIKDDCECGKVVARNALALITSQEQKIFELENRLKECENGYEGTLFLDRCKLHDAEEKVKQLTAEKEVLAAELNNYKEWYFKTAEDNERLRLDVEVVGAELSRYTENIVQMAKQDEADTVKEFAERLTSFFENDEYLETAEVDAEYINEQIGNIAKEMLEGKTSHFYHREAEKNLRLLNEARGVVWHTVADELPSENGTYLVVGKSGKVCTAHFYKEHTLHGKTYSWHFSNRYVRFWAKLPEPPIPG